MQKTFDSISESDCFLFPKGDIEVFSALDFLTRIRIGFLSFQKHVCLQIT